MGLVSWRPWIIVLKLGPARRVDPGPDRPKHVVGPGLSKKQAWNWPVRPGRPGTRLRPDLIIIIIIIIIRHTHTHTRPFIVKRSKREVLSIERNEHCSAEDLINFKPN
jgi:hypothetical protein